MNKCLMFDCGEKQDFPLCQHHFNKIGNVDTRNAIINAFNRRNRLKLRELLIKNMESAYIKIGKYKPYTHQHLTKRIENYIQDHIL